MTSKPQSAAADSTGLSSLSRFAPRLSLDSSLLASIIPLPENSLISYAVWSSAPSAKQADILALIEQARKRIIQQYASHFIVDSMLSSILISGDSVELYVFAIGSVERASDPQVALAQLAFAGLYRSDVFSFTPAGLYPCSDACAAQITPCSACTTVRPPLQATSSARLLPRTSLRRPFAQFLDAVRERLTLSVTESTHTGPMSPGMPATRLGSGFLFGTMSSETEWKTGWDRYSRDHPLTYCELTVHLTRTSHSSARLILQPYLKVTDYYPLLPSLPVAPGTPLLLLPHGAPAYFLSLYSGAASALTSQFEDALLGHGAGKWRRGKQRSPSTSGDDPVYVVIWAPVRSKPEDKGVVLVWPASLCVGFVPGTQSKHGQTRLDNLPALPAHMQASPPQAESHPPLALSSVRDPPPDLDIGLSLSQRSASTPTSSHPPSPSVSASHLPPRPLSHLGLSRTSSSHTLQAFRSLTLQYAPGGVEAATEEVSGFVGAVARERERERERLKRGRQLSGSIPTVGQETPVTPTAPPASSPPVAPEPMDVHVEEPTLVVQSPEARPRHRSGSLFSDDGSHADTSMQDESTNAAPAAPTPKVETEPQGPSQAPPSAPPPITASMGMDSFPGFDSGWSQSANDYNSGDYGMDFQLGMGDGGDLGMDDGFAVFTEDDFDFFDAPALSATADLTSMIAPPPIDIVTTTFASPAAAGQPLNVHTRPLDDVLSSAKGPLSAQSQSSPWTTFHGAESFTPQPDPLHVDTDTSHNVTQAHQERQLSSVQLVQQLPSPTYPPSIYPPRYPNAFEPIPFSTVHHANDGKYLLGKFALPSPPSEDDDFHHEKPCDSVKLPSATWKTSYSTKTDPRVGMTRKLSGLKRKHISQGGRLPLVSPGRFRAHDDWVEDETPVVEDNSDTDEECWIADDRLSPDLRPATPPPSSVPLGPALLQTHFHHPFLQTYAVTLSSTGAATHNTIATPAAISAPTPISPAAILGTSSEKTKSLEAAAQILLREAVENPVWADAWKACAAYRNPRQVLRDIWPVDVKRAALLLTGSDLLTSPIDIAALLNPGTATQTAMSGAVQPMHSPLITLSKSGEIINILPPALRFWEKLGLSPRSGPKNVVAFFVADQSQGQNEQDVVVLMQRISSLYSAKYYGEHSAGQAPGCSQAGIVPVRLETFRKTLSSFIPGLPHLNSDTSIVIYILTPNHILHLTSPVLRQILSAIKRVHKTRQSTSPILFQFVPEQLLASASSNSEPSALAAFVDSVYDRILCPVVRQVSCRSISSPEDTRSYQLKPAFTLAKPLHPEVKFVKEEAVTTLDVINRYSMLHVGYQVSRQGKWLLASCTDQCGEAHELKAWLVPEDEPVDSFIVNSVWEFVMSFATMANVEWHIVVAKRGAMTAREMDAWNSHLETTLHAASTLPTRVTLIAVEQHNPWYLLAKQSERESWTSSSVRSPKNGGSVAVDMSSTTIVLHSQSSVPLSLRDYAGALAEHLPEAEAPDSLPTEDLGMLPVATSTMVHIPSQMDHTAITMLHLHFLYLSQSSRSTSKLGIEEIRREVSRNLFELKVLAQARWGPCGSHNLPLHLAVLEVMLTTLDEPEGNGSVD
ncbi:hypothetical protein EIP91_008473 [Steccherinum ochraceum]|uniref:Mediator of RNA polymerase II transcription subunit 13 n=1 Tax=Steccherinum ochraceum TaxID=92696 RepID=A0A4V6N791_9APHY|nr:hypothetical protein EIP91_008473 [Steccherinum ochraceum]